MGKLYLIPTPVEMWNVTLRALRLLKEWTWIFSRRHAYQCQAEAL